MIDGNGNIYAGGYFTFAGEVAANNIAKWDGTTWSALGTGTNSHVRTLAVDDSRNLYAGGNFTTAGGVTVNHVARWDGTAWHPLGSGMDGYYEDSVGALAVGPDGSLYAGGPFTTVSGVAVNCIAKWDGSNWSALGSGMGGTVLALAFGPDGSLYAGGQFTTAGGMPANYIARWDGVTWHPLGSGVWGDFYPNVSVLLVGPDGTLYAGGDFTTTGGVAANHIAKWDGSQWSALGEGLNRFPLTLAMDRRGNLYAGGAFFTAGGVFAHHIAKWDGSTWSALGSGMHEWVWDLAADAHGYLLRRRLVLVDPFQSHCPLDRGGRPRHHRSRQLPLLRGQPARDRRGPARRPGQPGTHQHPTLRQELQQRSRPAPDGLLLADRGAKRGRRARFRLFCGLDPARDRLHPGRECRGVPQPRVGDELGLRHDFVYRKHDHPERRDAAFGLGGEQGEHRDIAALLAAGVALSGSGPGGMAG